MKVKLPLKYMNLEIGDLVKFDAILGGVKPYGIDYSVYSSINGQAIYENFLITSTNKTLNFIEIECIQMHDLIGECAPSDRDCAGVCDGTALADDCGICGGGGGTAECGCDDIPEGYCDCDCNVADECGVCGGGNADQDCNGVCSGGAYYDACGDCVGGNTGATYCVPDCSGEPGGTKTLDLCGECLEPNDSTRDLSCDECHELSDIFGTPYECGTPVPPGDPSNCSHYDVCQPGMPEGEGACLGVTNVADCADNYPNWTLVPLLMQTHLKPYENRGYDTNTPNDNSRMRVLIGLSELEDFGAYYKIPSEYFKLKIMDGIYQDTPSEATQSLDYKITVTSASEMTPAVICGSMMMESCPEVLDIPYDEWVENWWIDENDWTSPDLIDIWNGDGNYLFALHKNTLGVHIAEDRFYSFDFTLSLKILMWTDNDEYEWEKEYHFQVYIGDCLLGDMNGDGLWTGDEEGSSSLPGISDFWLLFNCIMADSCHTNDQWACAGDMNNDGGWNTDDIAALANCLLNNSCGGNNG